VLGPPDFLLARVQAEPWPVWSEGEPLRVVLASLAMGGAERIVLDWVDAEARRGRAVELALLHPRRRGFAPPKGVICLERAGESVEQFAARLCQRWRDARRPVSAHLAPDEVLGRFWVEGIATVPVVHNTREAWRNDPALWQAPHVPGAVACAEEVARQLRAAGAKVPITVLRHAPGLAPQAFDASERTRLRAELGVDDKTLLVAAVGALRPQKDYVRAIEVLAQLRRKTEAVLVILGGALDTAGLAELDRMIERALRLEVSEFLRLPGFVDPVAPWYAACDALLNVSRHEGFSMATREALCAGLPVFSTRVGGQDEWAHPALRLFPPETSPRVFASAISSVQPRRDLPRLTRQHREPRLWSLSIAAPQAGAERRDVLFVTANLNAGGAQRSLVNLLLHWPERQAVALAICAAPTHDYFGEALRQAGMCCRRAAPSGDPLDVARGVLDLAGALGAKRIVFWNVDARVKRLVAWFAPPDRVLIDVSPGAYGFEELAASAAYARSLGMREEAYGERLDFLVMKYPGGEHPPARRAVVIPNGVAGRALAPEARVPRFLVAGRIAPSKQLETILVALAMVRDEHPGVELDLFGQAEPRYAGYLSRIEAAAKGLPVRWRGAAPDLGYLAEPYLAAIVLGEHQGCPNAVLEALSAGMPVIANASGGTASVLRDGRSGWLLPETLAPEILAAAMRDAIRRPDEARRRGRLGRIDCVRHFPMSRMVASYGALFSGSLAPNISQC